MFMSATGSLMRRFAITAAGGASLMRPPQFFECADDSRHQPVQRGDSRHQLQRTRSSHTTPITIKTGKEFVKLFVADHKDSSGKIDMDKQVGLPAVKNLLEGAGGKAKHAKEIFDVIDQDHQGSITLAKIIAYFLAHADGSQAEKMTFLFSACDVDLSGTIEPAELKGIVLHMMQQKASRSGLHAVFQWHPVLYADIPQDCVLHLKANEFVHDVFTHATRNQEISVKEFIAWHLRGGKQSKRLDELFGLRHSTSH